jgi:hypothetical protein
MIALTTIEERTIIGDAKIYNNKSKLVVLFIGFLFFTINYYFMNFLTQQANLILSEKPKNDLQLLNHIALSFIPELMTVLVGVAILILVILQFAKMHYSNQAMQMTLKQAIEILRSKSNKSNYEKAAIFGLLMKLTQHLGLTNVTNIRNLEEMTEDQREKFANTNKAFNDRILNNPEISHKSIYQVLMGQLTPDQINYLKNE